MKNIRFLAFVLTITTLLLSACGAAAAPSTPAPVATAGSPKVDAMPVAFIGIVDRIADDQWVISGTTVTVPESVVRDGPFNAGDQIKVEGLVHPDGSLTILRVESPTARATATLPSVSDDNSNEGAINGNTNDGNINDDNSNGVNSNDDNSNDDNSNGSNTNDDNGGNSNDDNSNDDDDNSNDDNGGNSNDDNDNDDDSGNGGDDDDDNGNDD